MAFSCFSTNIDAKQEINTDALPGNNTDIEYEGSISQSFTDTHSRGMDLTDNDCNFVFRSKPIESCQYFKVLLLIASAEGYHHENNEPILFNDPKLSEKGIKQCKIVRKCLRLAKQNNPTLMLCSTLSRALTTLKLVCPDWYNDKDIIIKGLDILKPIKTGHNSDIRSDINKLQDIYKRIDFYDNNINDDIKKETNIQFNERINSLLNNYIVTKKELIQTKYGLKMFDDNNIPILNHRRVVIVSHRQYFNYLFNNYININSNETSNQFKKEWKHCDLRKVFVYTKQQLGIKKLPQLYKNNIVNLSKIITKMNHNESKINETQLNQLQHSNSVPHKTKKNKRKWNKQKSGKKFDLYVKNALKTDIPSMANTLSSISKVMLESSKSQPTTPNAKNKKILAQYKGNIFKFNNNNNNNTNNNNYSDSDTMTSNSNIQYEKDQFYQLDLGSELALNKKINNNNDSNEDESKLFDGNQYSKFITSSSSNINVNSNGIPIKIPKLSKTDSSLLEQKRSIHNESSINKAKIKHVRVKSNIERKKLSLKNIKKANKKGPIIIVTPPKKI